MALRDQWVTETDAGRAWLRNLVLEVLQVLPDIIDTKTWIAEGWVPRSELISYVMERWHPPFTRPFNGPERERAMGLVAAMTGILEAEGRIESANLPTVGSTTNILDCVRQISLLDAVAKAASEDSCAGAPVLDEAGDHPRALQGPEG